MAEYREYISALRQCAKEHENENLFTGQIDTTALCNDTAKLLENDVIERSKINKAIENIKQDVIEYSGTGEEVIQAYCDGLKKALEYLENIGE